MRAISCGHIAGSEEVTLGYFFSSLRPIGNLKVCKLPPRAHVRWDIVRSKFQACTGIEGRVVVVMNHDRYLRLAFGKSGLNGKHVWEVDIFKLTMCPKYSYKVGAFGMDPRG